MLVIDRFEGDFALCENEAREPLSIPRSALPAGAREGDVLVSPNGSFQIDKEETEKRRKEAAARFRRIFRSEK